MEKTFFQISFILAIAFFIAFFICSLWLSGNPGAPAALGVKTMGTSFMKCWLLFFVSAVVFAGAHMLKKDRRQ